MSSRRARRDEPSAEDGYDILASLDPHSRIDLEWWRRNPELCRVRRFERGVSDWMGVLRRGAGRIWCFDEEPGREDDEMGFRLATVR